jgi:hypothetical protein
MNDRARAMRDDDRAYRVTIARFAQWCVGSCYGDWSPEHDAIFDEVLRDDATFEHYRAQYEEYTLEKST